MYTLEQRWKILRHYFENYSNVAEWKSYASYAWISGPAIDLQKMTILAHKYHLFIKSSFWSWRVCKPIKLLHLGHWKSARIHWKAKAQKRSHCLVRILDQRHNWAIFLRKWTRRGHYSQWRSLSGHVERSLVHKNWRGEYWQHLVSTGWRYVPHRRSYTRFFAPYFEDRLATSEVWSDTIGLLFVWCRQR